MAGDRDRKVWQYLTPVLAVGLAETIVFLVPAFVERGAFLLFLAAVSISAWYGGWRSSIVALGLSALCAAWFVLPPSGSPVLDNGDDILRLGLFLLIGALSSTLHARWQRAVTALQHSEQRLALALDAAGMGAWEFDLSSGVFLWSPGLERVFGRSADDFALDYQGFLGYVHPDDQDFLNRALLHGDSAEQSFEIEHRIKTPTGEIRWIITRGRIWRDASGAPQRLIALASDITARKSRERGDTSSPAA